MNLHLGDTQLIIKEAKSRGVLRNQLAYILATAKYETAHTMKPVREAYWLSEQWRQDNLRYYPFYGRGYVQLTWRRNYQHAGKVFGEDFVRNPNKVMQPNYAVKILVVGMMEGWFTGKKLPDYVDLEHSDFHNARRVVNGTDKASEIAQIARDYDVALKGMGYGESAKSSYRGFLHWLLGWLASLGKQ